MLSPSGPGKPWRQYLRRITISSPPFSPPLLPILNLQPPFPASALSPICLSQYPPRPLCPCTYSFIPSLPFPSVSFNRIPETHIFSYPEYLALCVTTVVNIPLFLFTSPPPANEPVLISPTPQLLPSPFLSLMSSLHHWLPRHSFSHPSQQCQVNVSFRSLSRHLIPSPCLSCPPCSFWPQPLALWCECLAQSATEVPHFWGCYWEVFGPSDSGNFLTDHHPKPVFF